jgi:hypothetical protein
MVAKAGPRGENVADLMDALRKSIGGDAAVAGLVKKPAKKPREVASGQKEMLMPIAGKNPAKELRRRSRRPDRSGSRLKTKAHPFLERRKGVVPLWLGFGALGASAGRGPGCREPCRFASWPSGFYPSRDHASLAGGTRSRAPPSL